MTYAAWVGATYLLEGLPRTLQRPEAEGLRALYAVFASLPGWAKRHAAVRFLGVVTVLTPVLAACAAPLRVDPAGPGVPRVTEVRFSRDRVVRGCPVTMTVAFEDTDRDVVRVTVHSRHEKGKTSLQSFPVSVAGPPDASATGRRDDTSLHLRPEELGRHWYHVQVEDAGGHRSNVVRELLLVDGPLPWRPQRCD